MKAKVGRALCAAFLTPLPPNRIETTDCTERTESILRHSLRPRIPLPFATARLRRGEGRLSADPGYPYFLQGWGYQAWNRAEASPITARVVKAATARIIQRLDENFFRVRFDRLTPGEKRFLRAMAGLGPGPHRSGDIATALGVRIGSLGPVRANLIKKGMVYRPAHGGMAFTVPLFDEFMLRKDAWEFGDWESDLLK